MTRYLNERAEQDAFEAYYGDDAEQAAAYGMPDPSRRRRPIDPDEEPQDQESP